MFQTKLCVPNDLTTVLIPVIIVYARRFSCNQGPGGLALAVQCIHSIGYLPTIHHGISATLMYGSMYASVRSHVLH
jgi:hypothetical protein